MWAQSFSRGVSWASPHALQREVMKDQLLQEMWGFSEGLPSEGGITALVLLCCTACCLLKFRKKTPAMRKMQDVNVHSSEPSLWTSGTAMFSNQGDPSARFSVLGQWARMISEENKKLIIILYNTRDHPLIPSMACLWPLKQCSPSEEQEQTCKWLLLAWNQDHEH